MLVFTIKYQILQLWSISITKSTMLVATDTHVLDSVGCLTLPASFTAPYGQAKTFFSNSQLSGECYEIVKGLNALLIILFVLLQVTVIFTLPRLNIHSHKVINR